MQRSRKTYRSPAEPQPPPSTDGGSSAGSSSSGSKKGDVRGVFSGNLLGFALTSTDTQRAGVGAREATSYGVTINYDAAGATAPIGGSGRVHYRGALGGGSGGFDGIYESLVTVGPVFGNALVGLAPRVGLGAGLRGNERFYRSNLSLPRGDLALQLFPAKGVFLEGGLTGAYNLVGRFNIEDTSRRTGASWQAGAFGIVGISILSGSVQATREYVRSGPGTPIETLEINGCVNPLSALALCGNYITARGDGLVGGEVVRTGVQTLQFSIGLGVVRSN
jgi:hypothetical protein